MEALAASSREGPQLVEDLALGGETPGVVFGEDLPVIDGDHEDASASADDFAVDPELLLDLSRQTGGSGKVVSNSAVVDSDVHDAIVFTRTAVMLSSPPRSFAASMSC